jgi:murein DD-endopeptidase MepM/ murein hydrolase activator NlpD
VGVLRVNESGRILQVLGIMHDTGVGGDFAGGDGVFTARVRLRLTTPGVIYIRVAALVPGSRPAELDDFQRTRRGGPAVALSPITRVPVYAVVAKRENTIGTSGGNITLTGTATLTIPSGALATSAQVRVTQLQSTMFGDLAPVLGPGYQLVPSAPQIEVQTSQPFQNPVSLVLSSNALPTLGQHTEVRLVLWQEQFGSNNERIESLVGLRAELCQNDQAVCATLQPDDFYQYNPYVVQLTIGLYEPPLLGVLPAKILQLDNLDPGDGTNRTVAPGEPLTFGGRLTVRSPFAPGTPLFSTIITRGFCKEPCFHPLYNDYRKHNGVDLAATDGTRVRAPLEGIVTTQNEGAERGYGYYADVSHLTVPPIETRYAHLTENTALDGATIAEGQELALSGRTGAVSGPHLHFETTINGLPIDPAPLVFGSPAPFLPITLTLEMAPGSIFRVIGTFEVGGVASPSGPLSEDFTFTVSSSLLELDCQTAACEFRLTSHSQVLGTHELARWSVQVATAPDVTEGFSAVGELTNHSSGCVYRTEHKFTDVVLVLGQDTGTFSASLQTITGPVVSGPFPNSIPFCPAAGGNGIEIAVGPVHPFLLQLNVMRDGMGVSFSSFGDPRNTLTGSATEVTATVNFTDNASNLGSLGNFSTFSTGSGTLSRQIEGPSFPQTYID